MQPSQRQPIVHLPGEGRAVDLGAFGMTVKVEADQTGGTFTLLESEWDQFRAAS